MVAARRLPLSLIGSLTCVLWASLFMSVPARANVHSMMPDFYAEPGLNPFRDPVAANVNEVIDPFSGGLHLSHVDLVVPGNGGFDIKIQRSYNSNNVYLSRKTPLNLAPNLTTLLPRTPFGMGWTLHFGRVLKSEDASGIVNVCDVGLPGSDTLNDAILELPDGSQQILYVNGTSFNARFITREQWVANCITGGLLVTSPDGVQYTMTKQVAGSNTYTAAVDHAWYPTHIQDRNGNYIDLTYLTLASNKNALVSRITASDGRIVDFGYTNSTDAANVLLTSITANGQTWQYQYTADPGGGGQYQLTTVRRPDGLTWGYRYYSKTAGQPGNKVLWQVTYPYDATVTYDYAYVCFGPIACSSAYDSFYSLVVATKINSGRGVVAGTWTYSYAPSTTEDVTTVTFPGGKYVYKHFGSKLLSGGSTIPGKTLWKIGLLKEQQTYNGSTLVNDAVYTWDAPYVLSYELYVRPPYDGTDPYISRYADAAVFVPVLLRKDITRDGTTYTTTYSNFATADGSFNPQTITETGQTNRTTNLTYFPRTASQNIVRLVKDETAPSGYCPSGCANRDITRTFDAYGNPTSVNRYGVLDKYDYSTGGDLFRRTNARNFVWTYNNYYRGVPSKETLPVASSTTITINRTINATGTIANVTNGRNYTTSYTYDGMNRLKSITPPRAGSSATSVIWTSTGRTVARGVYSQTTTYDGFGRVSYVNTGGVTQDISYDALGHKSFESYYSSASGDSYVNDVLGRVTNITHADGTTRSFQYLANNVVRITNERNYATTLTHRSYGDPDNRTDTVLMRADAPEGVSTIYTRNDLGLPLTISQGTVTRSYTYSPTNNFLLTVNNPETGTTTFGRDAVGNMISRRVGSSYETDYTYDGLNRLTFTNYAVGLSVGTPSFDTPDVTRGYDNNSNVTLVDNGVARREFTYDENDNLSTEKLLIAGRAYTATYTHDNLDFVSDVTYPSLQKVLYSPDSLGRPTVTSPYITSIAYYPNGTPKTLNYANGQITDVSLNSRQWIATLGAHKTGVAAITGLTYGYDGLANVTGITDAVDATNSKSLTYDGLDRLKTAGANTVSYNTDDNITTLSTPKGSLTYSYSANRLSGVSGYQSRTFTYDAYGNITGDGRLGFRYDEGPNLRIVSGAVSAVNDYDGNNMRVHSSKNGIDTYSFYAANGDLLGEYNASGVWLKEYAYLNAKLIAMSMNPPDTPTGLIAPSIHSTGSYVISWSAVTGGVTHYELYQANNAGMANATLVYSGPGSSVNLTGRPPGTYYYEVRACNGTICTTYFVSSIAVSIVVPDGDLNGDGKTDGADVLIAQRILGGQIAPTEAQRARADMAPYTNGGPVPDNILGVEDLLVIERKALGLVN